MVTTKKNQPFSLHEKNFHFNGEEELHSYFFPARKKKTDRQNQSARHIDKQLETLLFVL